MPKSSSSRSSHSSVTYDSSVVSNTFFTVTNWQVLIYYALALWYSFNYAPAALETRENVEHSLVKVLPLIYLLELIRHAPISVCDTHKGYCRLIMLGIASCAVSDALMAWDSSYLLFVLGLLTLGHICFAAAFYQFYQGSAYLKLMLPFYLVICVLIFFVIPDRVTSVIVIDFTLFLTAMSYFALSRFEKNRTPPAYLAWAGTKLFILYDVMFVVNELVPQLERPVGNSVVMMTYYLAQLGIALSVKGSP